MKKEAMLYETVEGNKVRCRLCSHQCTIADGKFGFCGVRRNTAGTLYTMVFGEAIARNVDPIEKKPLYHFLPGSRSLSIATVGCNFHCGFCQNWQISQISQRQEESAFEGHWFPPEAVVEEAKRRRCASISYTYTEPTIFFEYAYETAALSRESDIRNVFVTNGYMSRRALDTMAPYLDAANVDLKAWGDAYYKTVCKAHLEPVLDTIRHMKELGIWLEVTTLIIPGENDSDEQLEGIGQFIAEVGIETPWHISRFYPDYQFSDREATPLETLERAKAIGARQGLRYVYLGNVPADTRTYCHRCSEVVITRDGDGSKGINLKNGKCPACGAEIDGVWA
jgi:pyruvate formate lyase activating enzyme